MSSTYDVFGETVPIRLPFATYCCRCYVSVHGMQDNIECNIRMILQKTNANDVRWILKNVTNSESLNVAI